MKPHYMTILIALSFVAGCAIVGGYLYYGETCPYVVNQAEKNPSNYSIAVMACKLLYVHTTP